MPATAPVKEIGYAQAINYNWWLYEDETTPELIWPQSVFVFDQMRRQDAQVASVLRAVTLPVRRTPWRIDPAGARARVVKFVADDLGLPIVGKNPTAPPRLKDRFSWPEHLRQALLMLIFGHMYFEQVYRVDDAGTAAHLRKLAPRPPKTIERIDVAPDGGLISIKQWWTKTDERPEPIPVDRLVGYVHDREGGNWLGNSLLRPAYKHWLIKDRLLRVQAQTIERNGMGIPLYKAQEGAEPVDIAKGAAMAQAWRAGEAAGSAVPFGADLVLRGVEGTLPDADPAIRYHDEQIARAVLAHFLNLGTQTGSWALGTTFADFFTLSLQTLAQQLADTATQHIVEDLVDVNFGENEPAPRIVFDEIGSRQAATAEAIKALVDAGVIRPDEVLEESSRQQYGLPPADASSTRNPPAPASATPSPATPVDPMSTSVAAKFKPDEPREPHSGKWVGHGGGAAHMLTRVEDVAVSDEGKGNTKLEFPGGASFTLSGRQVTRLYNVLNSMDLDPGDPESTYEHPKERHTFKLSDGPLTLSGWGSYEDGTDMIRVEHGGSHVDVKSDLASGLAEHIANAAPDEVQAAAGIDTHPGGEQLKHYWVYGEGAAKWSTWTELRDHLLKYLNPEMAKRTAAEWFHLRYGFWPGADVNRVKHGKPPRGHLVGPG
jgi:hypothetical protein